jgi:hypothetical protein
MGSSKTESSAALLLWARKNEGTRGPQGKCGGKGDGRQEAGAKGREIGAGGRISEAGFRNSSYRKAETLKERNAEKVKH